MAISQDESQTAEGQAEDALLKAGTEAAKANLRARRMEAEPEPEAPPKKSRKTVRSKQAKKR